MKASERSPALEHALVPRAILAWIKSASMYDGDLPGVDGAVVSFEKSETGFAGSIGIGEGLYKFQSASVFHLAASVAVALGVSQDEDADDVRDLDLERLGKSIDILAKARRATVELAKAFCPGCTFKTDKHREGCEKAELEKAALESHHDAKDGAACEDCGKSWKDHDAALCSRSLEKGKEGPGTAAAPLAPTAPAAPTATAPQPQKTTLPTPAGSAQVAKPSKPVTPPKNTSVRLTRSEAVHECAACGQRQFGADPFVFRGCACFRALAAGVRVLGKSDDVVVLQMDNRIWDRDGLVTFLESVGRA